jgi:SAM-dependent methyltransferase
MAYDVMVDHEHAYDSAVSDGLYQHDSGGLHGKHDNVRRYWEDQINRYILRESLAPMVARKQKDLSRIRVIDLGCGTGEGYEILTNVQHGNTPLSATEVQVLSTEMMSAYKGVDVSPEMVRKAAHLYQDNPKLSFEVGDLTEGLPVEPYEPAYDIYFSSFGSLSHISTEQLERLIEQIMDHFKRRCIFVGDLVARYSIEWPGYWDEGDEDSDKMLPYSMSYMYPSETVQFEEADRFDLRFWGGDEFDKFVAGIAKRRGVKVFKRTIHDRSVLVGRHMDTGEYNPHVKPIRRAVNSLHKFDERTELTDLIFDYVPCAGQEKLSEFFERFQVAWNAVVYACIDALAVGVTPDRLNEDPPEEYPEIVRSSIRTIRDVIRNIRWFRMGDPRANIIEPQLGYILRNLEQDMQQGLGASHGVLAVYEFEKD